MRVALTVFALAITAPASAQDILSFKKRLDFTAWPKDVQTAYVMGVTDGFGGSQFFDLDSKVLIEIRQCLFNKAISAEQIRLTTISVIDAAPEILDQPAAQAVAVALSRICKIDLPKFDAELVR